jgi:hypothetical protein
MTETINPTPTDEPKADETFTWTNEAPDAAKGAGASTAASILDSVREVVDELAERAAPTVRDLADRAAPTVREFSARAAELTAVAADRAAPFAKRVGEVTADASGKLAAKSREWAADLRSSDVHAEPKSESTPSQDAPDAAPREGGSATTDEPGPN